MSPSRRPARFTARTLMQPLRVAAGCSEPVGKACARMTSQDAVAAPVIDGGRTRGLLTLDEASRAVRHGLGSVSCGALIVGPVRFVAPTAGPRALHEASRGVCSALLVGSADGELLGVIGRRELDARLESLRRSARPPAWLAGRDLRRILRARLGTSRAEVLREAGRAARGRREAVYLVGGIVRDLLLGSAGKDLDLVVEGDGIGFARALAGRLDGSVTVHGMFGTAVLESSTHGRIDIATARRESYAAPGTLPDVVPGSLLDDMLRRDVTINGMAIRLDGPATGRLRDDLLGVRDLAARTLRIIHMQTFVEDPTRALRVARLATRLGFRLSPETQQAIDLASRHGAFDALSGERLVREFSLLFGEPDPAAAIAVLASVDLLSRLGPGLAWNVSLARSIRRLVTRVRSGVPPGPGADPVLATLMILSAAASPKARSALASRLAIRGRHRERLLAFSAAHRALSRLAAKSAARSRIARACDRLDPTTLLASQAAGGAGLRKAIARYTTQDRVVRPALTADDLMRMGVPRGPHLGRILEALRRARIDGLLADADSERRLVRRLLRRADAPGKRPRSR